MQLSFLIIRYWCIRNNIEFLFSYRKYSKFNLHVYILYVALSIHAFVQVWKFYYIFTIYDSSINQLHLLNIWLDTSLPSGYRNFGGKYGWNFLNPDYVCIHNIFRKYDLRYLTNKSFMFQIRKTLPFSHKIFIKSALKTSKPNFKSFKRTLCLSWN